MGAQGQHIKSKCHLRSAQKAKELAQVFSHSLAEWSDSTSLHCTTNFIATVDKEGGGGSCKGTHYYVCNAISKTWFVQRQKCRRPKTVDCVERPHRPERDQRPEQAQHNTQKTINIICVWIYWATTRQIARLPQRLAASLRPKRLLGRLRNSEAIQIKRDLQTSLSLSKTCHNTPSSPPIRIADFQFLFYRSNEPLTRSCRRPRK